MGMMADSEVQVASELSDSCVQVGESKSELAQLMNVIDMKITAKERPTLSEVSTQFGSELHSLSS